MAKEEWNDGVTRSYSNDPDKAVREMLAESCCMKCGLPAQTMVNGVCLTCDPTGGGCFGSHL